MPELKTDEAVAATIQTAPRQIEEAAPMQVEEAADRTGVEMGVGGGVQVAAALGAQGAVSWALECGEVAAERWAAGLDVDGFETQFI